MAKTHALVSAFNRGVVGKLALARTDVDRIRLSAEEQVNWLPRTLGPMTLRPGLQKVAQTHGDLTCKVFPFIYSAADTAGLEFTDSTMRVLVNEAPITRPAVSTAVADFDNSAAFTSTTAGGGSVSFTGSKLTLSLGSTGGVARAVQAVALGSGASGVEHALRIVVENGPVRFRVGTTSGAEDLFSVSTLATGTHSLAFTPTGTFYIQFDGATTLSKVVSSMTLEAAGVMTLPTPWLEADLTRMRGVQSADVVFMACKNRQQRRIERRSARSWSVVLYLPEDGPFNTNANDTISITPSALNGSVTLSASQSIFRSGHVGGLIRLFHTGQKVSASLSASDTYTQPIRVTGANDADRAFFVVIGGTFTGTLTLQRSLDGAESGYTDYAIILPGDSSPTDHLANSIAWYRVGFKPGNYTSGTATIDMSYQGGGAAGVARITGFTSGTEVSAEVLNDFSNTTETRNWKFGAWSNANGWPTAVEMHEGRLWWAGNDRWWGSVSDNYGSFDGETEGDSGPIDRTIGAGPIANINWLMSLQRLVAGADASVIQAKSSSFDEPLTPTNFNLKNIATQGSAMLPPARVDTRAVFVQQSGRRVYELLYDVQSYDYKINDLTRLNPDIGVPGFVDIAVQRQPDTMVHLVRADGTVAVLLYDPQDEVDAWWRIETDGVIESAFVLPGSLEDKVYYVVKRTINGADKRFVERFARLDECVGGTLNKQADCFVTYEGSATATITGLDHLEGEAVVVWADGKDYSPLVDGVQTTYTVTGGQITLPAAVSSAVVGLPYTALYRSSKLAYAAQMGTALTMTKRLDHLGLIMADTHAKGLRYGQSEDALDNLPEMENGKAVGADEIRAVYDEPMVELNGVWETDARLVLKAMAPRPCTVMAAVLSLTTNG